MLVVFAAAAVLVCAVVVTSAPLLGSPDRQESRVTVRDTSGRPGALSPVPHAVRLSGRGAPVAGAVGLTATRRSDTAAVAEVERLLRRAGATRIVRTGAGADHPD
ncbi:MAG: hypothetical protein ACRDPK_10835, partial [Carbonactinosporaceae bacterium]